MTTREDCMDTEPDEMKFQELIARSLANVQAEEFRAIVATVLREALERYDAKQLILTALQPLVQQMLRDMLNDPAVLEALRVRVLAQTHSLIGRLKLDVGRDY